MANKRGRPIVMKNLGFNKNDKATNKILASGRNKPWGAAKPPVAKPGLPKGGKL